MSSLECFGDNKIRDRMHGELPETALDVRGPEDIKDSLRTTRYKCLEEVGGCWVSKKGGEVVASFRQGRRIAICGAVSELVNLQEILAYETRISSRPRHDP